jgi:leucyl-tRNA synthetase
LKTELEQIDYEVFIPNLPNADYPELSEWVNELCKLPINSTDEVVVIGHSLGGPAACKFVEQKNIKIKKLILISPTGTEQEKDWSGLKAVGLNEKALECIHNFNSAEKDWGKIKNLTEESVIYMSDNDPFIPLEVRNDYKDLQAKIKDFSGKGHFNRKVGMTKFEAILSEFNYGEKLNAGWIPLSESELPLELPKVKKYEPTDTGESPLAAMTDWVKTKCPVCGGEARRETDTMPNWAGSSWYFLAYTMSRNHKSKIINHKSSEFVWDRKTIDYWNPVDWYNGGMEHTVLHLLYSRFWNQFLFDLGLVPTLEPYKKRTSHGMILAADGEKMSKSRGNVINPDEMVERFGTDAFRTYIMFMGPFDQAVAWDTNGLVGVRRFLDKVWGLQEKIKRSEDQKIIVKTKLETLLHQTIKKVSEDIEAMRFNTAVAQLMILVNEMSKEEQISPISYLLLLQLLSPFAPHMAEELWAELGNKDSICLSEWPEYDRELIVDDEITVVCQVNGKVRDEFKVPVGITEEEIKKLVLESEKVQKWLEGKEPKKIIYVKSKLVSVVV